MTVAEMTLTGEMLIGARSVRGTEDTIHAVNPATGVEMEPAFGGGSERDVDAACVLAEAAFNPFRAVSLEKRAEFLEAIAQGILDLGDVLVERVMAESGLPRRTGRRRTWAHGRAVAAVCFTGSGRPLAECDD